MKIFSIVLFALIALASALLLAPLSILVDARHQLAGYAMRWNMPSTAAAILQALAKTGDRRALNNAGVLLAVGRWSPEAEVRAANYFKQALKAGSHRSLINLALIEMGGCGANVEHAAATATVLRALPKEDDARAVGLILECFYFEATGNLVPDRREYAAEAADIVRRSGNSVLQIETGWRLLNMARGVTRPLNNDRNEREQYNKLVAPLARKAMQLFFAAADAGDARAYDPLLMIKRQFDEALAFDPDADRLRGKTEIQWLETAARKGGWWAQCILAKQRIGELRRKNTQHDQAERASAIAAAQHCITREPQTFPQDHWYDDEEWLADTTPPLLWTLNPDIEGVSKSLSFLALGEKAADSRPKP